MSIQPEKTIQYAVKETVDKLSSTWSWHRISDPDRLNELRATGLLDGRSIPALDGLTALAQRLLRAQVATVSLVDDEFQHFVSWTGPNAPEGGRIPLSQSFCRYAVATGERLMVPDTGKSPLLSPLPALTNGGWGAYAGAPLESPSGHLLGTLCVVGTEPRDWSHEDEEVLSELAAIATAEIDFRLHARTMSAVEMLVRELGEPVELLGDSVKRLSGDAERGAPAARIERLAAQAHDRFDSVESLARELTEAIASGARSRRGRGRVNVGEALARAVRLASLAAPEGDIELALADGGDPWIAREPYELQLALSHLVVSALHHSDPEQPVEIRLESAGADALIVVETRGPAMSGRALGRRRAP
jgi:GAF domain-containing protein